MIVHDGTDGISAFASAPDMEIYGNLIYNNGWDGATDRGHGHGLYIQNQTGTKKIAENISFNNYGQGIQIYGSSSAYLDNISLIGSVFFNNGAPSIYGYSRNILFGGDSVAHNGQILNTYAYYSGVGPPSNIGYNAGVSGFTIQDSWFAASSGGGSADFNGGTWTMTGNRFFQPTSGINQSSYPANTYYNTTRPTGTFVYVRPNAYEAGRANITVYNWDRKATVAVDVSSVLTVGAQFEVRNAQDFFAAPVLSGVYAGGTLTLPMTGLTVVAPIGGTAPPPTGPDFNVFVLLPYWSTCFFVGEGVPRHCRTAPAPSPVQAKRRNG
jgi:hypothetical protein